MTSLIANGLLKNEALAEGYDDAVLVRDGIVTEGTRRTSSSFQKDIKTPPKSNHLLHGITRDLVIRLAEEAEMPLANVNG